MAPIVGFVRKVRASEPGFLDRTLAKMAGSALHATYSNDELGWAVGMLSSSQPAKVGQWNGKRTIGLWLAGGLFPMGEAESLPRCYEERGEACLKELNGRFAGTILDVAQGKLILFNDRFGLGRIYFYEDEEALYFASRAAHCCE